MTGTTTKPDGTLKALKAIAADPNHFSPAVIKSAVENILAMYAESTDYAVSLQEALRLAIQCIPVTVLCTSAAAAHEEWMGLLERGHEIGTKRDCPACKGSGEMPAQARISGTADESEDITVACARCEGTGEWRCCGAADPGCTTWESSCQNPANYPPPQRGHAVVPGNGPTPRCHAASFNAVVAGPDGPIPDAPIQTVVEVAFAQGLELEVRALERHSQSPTVGRLPKHTPSCAFNLPGAAPCDCGASYRRPSQVSKQEADRG